MEETICVLLTPPGRGAIATVLVAGPKAAAICGVGGSGDNSPAVLHFTLSGDGGLPELLPGAVRLARRGGPGGEEVILVRVAHDQVEIQCHGGMAASRAILDALQGGGCRQVPWEEWIRRIEADPLAAEARILLARAPTLRTSRVLLDQWQGALRREVLAVIDSLGRGQVEEARGQLTRLLNQAPVGLHLVDPWRVVLAGRPNVGKSSLINALVGFERSIVLDQPGTTRDRVTVLTAIDGWPVELSDTAGLRQGGGSLERAGMERAGEAIARADLLLWVTDATDPQSAEPHPALRRQGPSLLVENKCDVLPPAEGLSPSTIRTSAIRGDGMHELISAISHGLVPTPPPPSAGVPFLPTQVAALENAIERLTSSPLSVADALRTLGAHVELQKTSRLGPMG